MTFWEKIKDNWSQLALVSVVLLALVTTYVQVRVSAIALAEIKSDAATLHINKLIQAKLDTVHIPTDGKIATMDSERSANKEAIGIERERLNEVGRILMKPPSSN